MSHLPLPARPRPPPAQAPAGKRYFPHTSLADLVGAYPLKPGLSEPEEGRERCAREALLDLLLGVLDVDPRTRWVGGCGRVVGSDVGLGCRMAAVLSLSTL